MHRSYIVHLISPSSPNHTEILVKCTCCTASTSLRWGDVTSKSNFLSAAWQQSDGTSAADVTSASGCWVDKRAKVSITETYYIRQTRCLIGRHLNIKVACCLDSNTQADKQPRKDLPDNIQPTYYIQPFTNDFMQITSSPAVAERLHDASWLSVASTVQYVECNVLLLVTSLQTYCCV